MLHKFSNSGILNPIDIKTGMGHNLNVLSSKMVFNSDLRSYDVIMTSSMLSVNKFFQGFFFALTCL